MSQDQLLPINIVIGDRSYRIRITPEDEESVRMITKKINDKILEFKTNFAGKDMQDYIAMVLIWLATEEEQPTPSDFSPDEMKSKIKQLQKIIQDALEA